jgi:hypothetical protein
MKIQYSFSSKVWQYKGQGGWYFVSLPEALSAEIRAALKSEEQGWGRLKVTAQIGKYDWETAIWFDTKANTYLLPLKADIRRKEKIEANQMVQVMLAI